MVGLSPHLLRTLHEGCLRVYEVFGNQSYQGSKTLNLFKWAAIKPSTLDPILFCWYFKLSSCSKTITPACQHLFWMLIWHSIRCIASPSADELKEQKPTYSEWPPNPDVTRNSLQASPPLPFTTTLRAYCIDKEMKAARNELTFLKLHS